MIEIIFNTEEIERLKPENLTVPINTIPNEPIIPQKTNSVFIGWFKDVELTIPFDWNNPIKENITLFPKFENDCSIFKFELTTENKNLKIGLALSSESMGRPYSEGFNSPNAIVGNNSYYNFFTSKVENDEKISTFNVWSDWKYSLFNNLIEGKIPNSKDTFGRANIKKIYELHIDDYSGAPANSNKVGRFEFVNLHNQPDLIIKNRTDALEIFKKLFITVVEGKYYCNYKSNILFNSNGGSSIPNIEVNYGEKIVKPTNPTKEGYTFVGWFKDSALTNEWNFEVDIMLINDITLYAKWEIEEIKPKDLSRLHIEFTESNAAIKVKVSDSVDAIKCVEVVGGVKVKKSDSDSAMLINL